MNLNFISIILLLGNLGYFIWDIASLKSTNEQLLTEKTSLLNANHSLVELNKKLTDDFINGLNALNSVKNKNQVEVRYVEKIKTQIIKDNNSSCLGSINDVFFRMRQKGNSAESNSSETATNK